MRLNNLDFWLRQLNTIEKDLVENHNVKLKEYFSNKVVQEYWTINCDKIMEDSEEIAIHKHDRFTAFEMHSHDYIEIMFVYSGSIKHEIKGKVIKLKKGEFLILDMNTEHSIQSAGVGDIAINILIKKEFFDWYFIRQIAYHDLLSKFVVDAIYMDKGKENYIHFTTTEKCATWHFMMQILNEYYEKKNGFITAIKGLMLLLFNELLRDYQKYLSEYNATKVDDSIINKVLDYIKTHYKSVTLNDLSTIFNYSPDYLGRLIKKRTGKPLKEIIKDLKFKKAEYLLTSTNMSITDIVHEIGYSNVSYFYKQFKEIHNLKPDEYRKQSINK